MSDHRETIEIAEKKCDETNDAIGIAGREIITTRIFDAPRELVFKAWTDPKHVAAWWGPNRSISILHDMEVREGGVWRFLMRGPDGIVQKNEIVFIEVVEPERLVYSQFSDPALRTTVSFDEKGSKTKVSIRTVFAAAAEYNRDRPFIDLSNRAQNSAPLWHIGSAIRLTELQYSTIGDSGE